jgi:hypothetical protein
MKKEKLTSREFARTARARQKQRWPADFAGPFTAH